VRMKIQKLVSGGALVSSSGTYTLHVLDAKLF